MYKTIFTYIFSLLYLSPPLSIIKKISVKPSIMSQPNGHLIFIYNNKDLTQTF